MPIHTESNYVDCSNVNRLELGALDPRELSVFSTLIGCRRPLPIYLGDAWRCDICQYECGDISGMKSHMIDAHEPEPMNSAEWAEMLSKGPGTGHLD